MADSPGAAADPVGSCPRCSARLPRAALAQHVWDMHRLILDGRAFREPWQLIESWVDAYRRAPSPWLLVRSRQLAEVVSPDRGLNRLRRLLLLHGVKDHEAIVALVTEAEAQNASLCPSCYNLVPCSSVPAVPSLEISDRRLAANGYRVEFSDKGLFRRLEVETPDETIHGGPPPGGRLSYRGAVLFLVGPLVAAALASDLALGWMHVSPLVPVVLLLAGAVLSFGAVRVFWRSPRPSPDRVMDYAWTELVPWLHRPVFSMRDGAFLAALSGAAISGRGDPHKRRAPLRLALHRTAGAVDIDRSLAPYLAPLWRLTIEDAAAAGCDPVGLLVTQVSRCLEGKLPLEFTERLLGGSGQLSWGPLGLARCRILVCDRAFEAGYEIRDLLVAGIVSPALGRLLKIGDPQGLAQLRLLWSLRAGSPWTALGEAMTAFQMAVSSSSMTLGDHPDALLQPLNGAGLVLTAQGVIFRGLRIERHPRSIEVRGATGAKEAAILLNGREFAIAEDATVLAARLERWCRFYFFDFLPAVGTVYRWQAPMPAPVYSDPRIVPCPTCRSLIVGRCGQMAVAAARVGPEETPG